MIQNIVIGKPLVPAWSLISTTEEEFNTFDVKYTLFTEERFLPALLVEAGIAPSRSEVRRNRSDLYKTLDTIDCLQIKYGKHFLFIAVGK